MTKEARKLMADLSGRRYVVTGGASGIGKATVERLRRDHASVLCVDRAESADIVVDVTDAAAADTVISAAREAMGGIDGVIPCAGICEFMAIDDHDDALWERTFAVNVTAVFRLVRAAVPSLRASNHGRVVLIGSIMSSFASSGLIAYAASKHAILGMARALASELGNDGVTVNCVQPGTIETPLTSGFLVEPGTGDYWRQKAALGRIGRPEDIADVVAFLVSDDARFLTGQGMLVDGGTMQQP